MTMIRTALAAAVLAAALSTAAAHAQSVDLAKSQVSFGFRQENVPGEGRFRRFTAQVAFDPARPEATSANVEVDVTSVDLGDPGWNNDIQGASWFATRQHPKAAFVASGAKAVGGGRFEAPARFTLKGITREVVATFTTRADAGGLWLEGTVPLRRIDFKIGEGAWADTGVVANDVAVRFRLYLKK
ncbi:MAG: YceI family protein [Burkholderiales bacterium]|nr:YceI family protein [Burkholderiales bacterium]